MKKFISSNPGLKSRFTGKIMFPDYSADELRTILFNQCVRDGYQIEAKTLDIAIQGLESEKSRSIKGFGNARSVMKLYEEMKNNLALRLLTLGNQDYENQETFILSTIDLPKISISNESEKGKFEKIYPSDFKYSYQFIFYN